MISTPNDPTFLFDDLPLHWQMTRWDKFGFVSILEAAKPKLAIEIGTYNGGSLQVISKYADRVYSIDTDPSLRKRLQFSNVDYLTGDSRQILPGLLQSLEGKELGFVLIDGDHSAEGVRTDINNVLHYRPNRPIFVVVHDSFNPDCRKGILLADWTDCDFVHYVEVDFVPGVYHFEPFDTAPPGSMFGGLCLAIMRPEPRTAPLTIYHSQKGLFDAVFATSCHAA
jgi:SAM-dependent methyltransferase